MQAVNFCGQGKFIMSENDRENFNHTASMAI